MHEISIMENMLAIALEQAQQQKASKIHRLVLRVGAVSGVEVDALIFVFDVVVQGTIAEEAKLEIDYLATICYCSHCHREFSPVDWIYDCPSCQQISLELRQGKELELTSMEVS